MRCDAETVCGPNSAQIVGKAPPCYTRSEGGEEAEDEGGEGGTYHQPRGDFAVDPSPVGPPENFVGGAVVVDQMVVEEAPRGGVGVVQENDRNVDQSGQGAQKIAV